jgi:hypothetical protein
VLGTFLHAGCAGAACVRYGSLGSGMGAGGRCLAPLVVGVRWSGPPLQRRGRLGVMCGRSRGGLVDSVSSRACVDAWSRAASSGSFRAVAPVDVWGPARLLFWGWVLYGKVPNNAYSQGSQELSASAGAY